MLFLLVGGELQIATSPQTHDTPLGAGLNLSRAFNWMNTRLIQDESLEMVHFSAYTVVLVSIALRDLGNLRNR